MKHAARLVLLVAAIGLVFSGCDRMWADQEVRPAFHMVSEPMTVDIIAGQHYDAGDIVVTVSGENMVVTITTADGWTMSESHVAVAADSGSLPRNKPGHLVPGSFPYRQKHDPPVTEYSYTIPVGEWEPGAEWALAVHVVVANGEQKETGWGEKWRGWFTYKPVCWKDVTLPDGYVRLRGWHPYTEGNSYWKIELGNVPPDYDVWDGIWRGWCAEQDVHMNPNTWYDVRLWSTLNPLLPGRVQNDGWDNVNYLLNNKHPQANWQEISEAMWFLLGAGPYPASGRARLMVDAALEFGDGFKPAPGGWIAVICETAQNIQLVFIEVDP
ncbi:MAG: hypothetical protein R6X14_09400 [bacterium]